MDDYKFAAILFDRMAINPIEALYLADALIKRPVSWSFAPTNVRYSLANLIQLRVLRIVKHTFEGDSQIYKFVELSDFGREMIGKALEQ